MEFHKLISNFYTDQGNLKGKKLSIPPLFYYLKYCIILVFGIWMRIYFILSIALLIYVNLQPENQVMSNKFLKLITTVK